MVETGGMSRIDRGFQSSRFPHSIYATSPVETQHVASLRLDMGQRSLLQRDVEVKQFLTGAVTNSGKQNVRSD
jgi:hypothetical protein